MQPVKNVSSVINCAGCFACYNVCPVNAINMNFSNEGFYTPYVNEALCTDCGRCLDVCPVEKTPSLEDRFLEPKTYVAWSLDDSIRLNSSSGGIYPEIARKVLEEKGVVFAVGWNNEWLPEHKEIVNWEQISETQGSKYVQSNVNLTYSRIVNYLKQGKKVLFVGTPCQVAGLRNTIKIFKIEEFKSNAILVDLVCFGVPSPKVFRKYLYENFDLSNIISINFRNKQIGWSKYQLRVTKKYGKDYKSLSYKDSFFYGFLINIYLARLCYNCPFSKVPRQGDITLGDFWGVPDKYKDEKGVSVVLVNSKKGEEIFFGLIKDKKIFAEQVSLETASKSNPRIISGEMKIPNEREQFFKDLDSKSWRYLTRKYIKPPVGLRSFIRRGFRFAKRVFKKIIKIITR